MSDISAYTPDPEMLIPHLLLGVATGIKPHPGWLIAVAFAMHQYSDTVGGEPMETTFVNYLEYGFGCLIGLALAQRTRKAERHR